MRAEDLYDVLKLGQCADRVLPNGWCLLPPKQTCERGNACLTCPVFTTDESHRDELTRQLDATDALIGIRQTTFKQRFGAPMPDDNIWLTGRRQERDALNRVLVALDQVKVRPGAAVRGAGSGELDITLTQGGPRRDRPPPRSRGRAARRLRATRPHRTRRPDQD